MLTAAELILTDSKEVVSLLPPVLSFDLTVVESAGFFP